MTKMHKNDTLIKFVLLFLELKQVKTPGQIL
jgi:hypothetical protein